MSKSQSIGIVAVIAAILVAVGMPVLKNAFSAQGITVRAGGASVSHAATGVEAASDRQILSPSRSW